MCNVDFIGRFDVLSEEDSWNVSKRLGKIVTSSYPGLNEWKIVTSVAETIENIRVHQNLKTVFLSLSENGGRISIIVSHDKGNVSFEDFEHTIGLVKKRKSSITDVGGRGLRIVQNCIAKITVMPTASGGAAWELTPN